MPVAIVGAGPSGIYAAQALVAQAAARGLPPVAVDLYDRLPTPYGLVRYGVAPDHPSIKAIMTTLEKTLDHPQVRFIGSVNLGDQITREQVRRAYHAVVYATGCQGEVRLGVEGEHLAGVWPSRQFVAWYNGHPDAPPVQVAGACSAAVIGLGNVAIDVARLLLKTADQLAGTDMAQPVLEQLGTHHIRDVWLIGRRGPQHAAFTTKELRELLTLDEVAVSVQPDGVLDVQDDPAWDRRVSANLAALRAAGQREVPSPRARLHCVFFHRPVQMQGSDGGHVQAITVERTRFDQAGLLTGTGDLLTIPVDLVVNAVGYRGLPLADVPFNELTGTVAHVQGRITEGAAPSVGEYVVGWAKRGPYGVVGTNKSDAAATVSALLDDMQAELLPTPQPGLADTLAERGSTYADWQRIDSAERAQGQRRGCQRIKLAGWEQLQQAIGQPAPPAWEQPTG